MERQEKRKKAYTQALVALLLLLAAGFWYKSSLQTQSQNKNQLPGANKNITMLKITSPAFLPDEAIPAKYTCDGADINPPLSISEVPEKTKSLALIVDDPDAPVGNWNHWVFWNVDPKVAEIAEDSIPPGAILGTNSFERLAYGGPCPPSGTHRYFFKLYALDSILDLPERSKKNDLEKTMEGHILEEAQLKGKYERLR